MFPLIVLVLCLPEVRSDSHSLSYHFTAVSAPGPGLPEFWKAGYVDDQQIDLYTSDTHRTVPVAQWLKKHEDPVYWQMETINDNYAEAAYRLELKTALFREFSDTGGFHFGQLLVSCELQDDGSFEVYAHAAINGREYLYLDTQTWTFIPVMDEARVHTQRWNSIDFLMRKVKYYLADKCNTLKRFIELGREALERRVRPRVKVTRRDLSGVTKLHCQVYGFYPRAVDVKWKKNGTEEIPLNETAHVLPNPDGTYQIRVALEVMPQEGDSYSCYVNHSSLEEPLLVKWESRQDFPLAGIISAVIIGLVLTSVMAGVIVYKKKKDNHTASGNKDERRLEF